VIVSEQAILLICTLLSPAITMLVIAGGLAMAFNWSGCGLRLVTLDIDHHSCRPLADN
jgi:hypothetical protein